MSLADDVLRALPGMRQQAESLMQDFGVMRRITGRTVQNEDGEEEPEFADVFTSRCKIQGTSDATPTTRTAVVGGVERPVIDAGVHLPLASPVVERGFVFEVTAVGPSSDPRLVGKRYWVESDPVKSFATARRLDVVEV